MSDAGARWTYLTSAVALSFLCSCGAVSGEGFGAWLATPSHHEVRARAIAFRWTRALTSEDNGGSYRPVERAAAALDPEGDRVYVGSSRGALWALSSRGRPYYRYDAGEAIESEPVLDRARDELYFGTEEGRLHAIGASNGRARWRTSVGGPIRNAPVLTEDAVYVVTETDIVTAIGRENGEILWRYRRDPPDGFSITGHAGLVIQDAIVITAFTDGVIAGLDATDGRVIWERDTDIDVEAGESSATVRFRDVDTTPVVFEGDVWVASIGAGLYRLDASNGSVLWRAPELTGVTSITATTTRKLVLSRSQDGLLCIDTQGRTLWHRPLRQGAAGTVRIWGKLLLLGESEGSIVAVHSESGDELGRLDAGTGFSGPVAIAAHRGFAVSNGGSLLAFEITGGVSPPARDWLFHQAPASL